ncbi:MAG: hypothetical protein ABIR71_12890, partial [Chthoniobacterales bacterium]
MNTTAQPALRRISPEEAENLRTDATTGPVKKRARGARRTQQKWKVRKYRDSKRPALKFVVNGREDGKRTRSFFSTKTEADTYAETKNVELLNSGTEGAEFPTELRVMARQCAALLE